MELSLLCDVKVFLFLYDKQSCNKLLHFQSDADDDFVAYLFKDCCNPKNFYSNENVSIKSPCLAWPSLVCPSLHLRKAIAWKEIYSFQAMALVFPGVESLQICISGAMARKSK